MVTAVLGRVSVQLQGGVLSSMRLHAKPAAAGAHSHTSAPLLVSLQEDGAMKYDHCASGVRRARIFELLTKSGVVVTTSEQLNITNVSSGA